MGCWKRSRGQWWQSEKRSSTGNAAFDEYRSDTLRRLEEEQKEFVDFLEKLRLAKDKAEFDQFMANRGRRPDGPAPEANSARRCPRHVLRSVPSQISTTPASAGVVSFLAGYAPTGAVIW
jgi:hypothetical protein